MQNVILHLDMNSFFASCEQQDNFAWRGRPLGVCEHLGGIIIAASVEAKKWGIKTGTPVWEARKLYPNIILTHTRPDAYRKYNHLLVKLVSDYTDKVEVYSIDEVFMDITVSCNIKFSISNFQFPNKSQFSISKSLNHQLRYFMRGRREEFVSADPLVEAVRMAKEIKQRMKTEIGDWLTCSVGIAENKLLAKIGSDLQKPDGLVVIRNPNIEIRNPKQILNLKSEILNPDNTDGKYLELTKDDLYHRLSLTDIPGIGHRQEKNLNALGIKTLLDLKNYSKSRLVARFGPIGGYHLYNLGQLVGSWKPKVESEEEIKSMGHMYTLPKEYREKKFFIPVLYKLCEMVGKRMRKQGLMGNIIHFYCHDKNYEGFGKSIRLGYFLQDGRDIFLHAAGLRKELDQANLPQIKLIGITVAGLRPFVHQSSLFGDDEKSRRLMESLDKINEKYGDFTVCRAPVLGAIDAFHDSIGFGRVKEV